MRTLLYCHNIIILNRNSILCKIMIIKRIHFFFFLTNISIYTLLLLLLLLYTEVIILRLLRNI